MPCYYQTHASPLGLLHIIVDDAALQAVLFDREHAETRTRYGELLEQPHPLIERTARQLDEYFAGERRSFDLPLHLAGTPFQEETWRALLTIPYGETRSYSQQAQVVGKPNAVRAIGRTNGLNPLSIIVPCHRVVGKSGHLTGYAGGLDKKQYLLALESKVSVNDQPLLR